MSKIKHCLVELTDTPSFQFDWEELKLQLNTKQFSVLVAEMPREPLNLTSSVTVGMYPIRNTNIFKKD
jgi:hypothetical protein